MYEEIYVFMVIYGLLIMEMKHIILMEILGLYHCLIDEVRFDADLTYFNYLKNY